MSVLVDSSVWIDYWRGSSRGEILDSLIDDNQIVVNELILTELIPALNISGQSKLITLLQLLPVNPLLIDWHEVRAIQTKCLKRGYSGIGIPDLILAQNAIKYNALFYTLDKHFHWISEITHLKLFE